MVRYMLSRIVTPYLICAYVVLTASSGNAQVIQAPLDRGFVRTTSIAVSVDEMLGPKKERAADEPILGPGYPALQIAEVQYKPLRYVRMPVTDPATGEVSRELVWYMVWRAIPRDYSELAGDGRDELLKKLNDPQTDPANTTDPLRAKTVMIPRFVLETNDTGSEQKYQDEVNLQIQQSVFRREIRGEVSGQKLFNSVQAITEFGDPVSNTAPDQLANAIYGVAVWRNIDPRTDFLTVYMTGFSNAYRISQDSNTGETKVEEKVIVQKFDRPGDEYRQEEAEFRVVGDPVWTYQAMPVSVSVPQFDTVLRNIPTNATAPAAP
jgi:hypothetical protein